MAKGNNIQIFKDWVPNWLVFVTLFIFLLPIASVLGVYMGGVSTAASYFGVDHTDIQYSMVVYYIAIASIFPLEAKFFNFFSSKPYLVGCVLIFMGINLAQYYTHNFGLFLVLRYVGGAISHGVVGIIFTLVFKQFYEQRSRVLGYATMYSVLFGSAPLSYLLDAYLFSNYNFNSLFLFIIFSMLPGTIMMCIIRRKSTDLRRNGKMPLRKSLDIVSFLLYTSTLLILAYFLLYGQYYHWLQSERMVFCLIAGIVCLIMFILRQITLKMPYIDLRIYKTRNFRIGMIMLIFFYLGKGDMNLLDSFLTSSVNLDVYHYGYVMLTNAVGVIAGALLGARYVLAGTRIRIIWLIGFGSLLLFHVFSLYVLNYQAEISDLLLPLFLQGFGNGILIISIVIFYVTAVPSEIGFSASVSGVAFRASTFSLSMCLMAVFGSRLNKVHYQSFANTVTQTNPMAMERLGQYKQALLQGGASVHESSAGAMKLLGKAVAEQNSLLFINDYYLYMSYLMVFVMVLIATIPNFTYQIKRLRSKYIPI